MTVNAALFAPVLDWLDRGAPETTTSPGFNMEYYMGENESDSAGTECGTVCCISGAVAFFNPQLGVEIQEHLYSCVEVFGLTDDQAVELFMAHEYLENQGGSLYEITPAHAARTIRHLIATGVVDWEAME